MPPPSRPPRSALPRPSNSSRQHEAAPPQQYGEVQSAQKGLKKALGAPGRLSLAALVRLSRPRFWSYLAGPYVVGLLAGASSVDDVLSWRALCFGLFFLFPANLFVYGVNDAHDFETDALNSKKQGYEARPERSTRRRLLALSFGFCAPFALLALLAVPTRAAAALGAFFFLAHQYSAPPIRAKARPFVDSAFNLLYACPAFFAHALLGGRGVDKAVVLAAWAWVWAMHAYSAIPDIQADRDAGVRTIATALGLRSTLLACTSLYILAAALSYAVLGWLSILLGAVYLVMAALSARAGAARGSAGVMQMYRFFPALNTLAGFLLFWRVAWIKFAPDIIDALARL